jgi:hypothetical protein
MMRLRNRRVLAWSLVALLLAGLAWGLYVLLPPAPRWVLRGVFGAGGLTADGQMYATTVEAGAWHDPSDWFARPSTSARVGPVQFWDIATGCELYSVLGGLDAAWHVGFSRDCQQVAAIGPLTGNAQRSALRWLDLVAGTERKTVFPCPLATWQPRVSPDGALLLLQDRNNHAEGLYLYETASLRLVAHVKDPDGWRPIWWWSSDGNAVYVYTNDMPATLRRIAADGDMTIALNGADRSRIVGPDGKTLLTYSADDPARLHVWDLETGTRRATVAADELPLLNLVEHVFTPDSRALMMPIGEDTVGIWDLERMRWIARVRYSGESPLFVGSHAVVVLDDEGKLTGYQLRPCNKLWRYEGKSIYAAEYLPDQARLVLANQSGGDIKYRMVTSREEGGDRLVLLDTRTGTPTLDIALDARATHHWLGRGRHFVVLTAPDGFAERGKIREFIEDEVLPLLTRNPPRGQVREAITVRVFDSPTGTERCRIKLPYAAIDGQAISPDGQTLILHQAARDGEDAAVLCYDLPPRRSWTYILGIPSALGALRLLVRVGSRRVWHRASVTARRSPPASPGGKGSVP